MIYLDAVPESFGTAIAAVFVVIPLAALVILVFRVIKRSKNEQQ